LGCQNGFASFLGVHTRHKTVLAVGVFLALFSVELTGLAGNALGDDLGVFINEDRHDSLSNQLRTELARFASLRTVPQIFTKQL